MPAHDPAPAPVRACSLLALRDMVAVPVRMQAQARRARPSTFASVPTARRRHSRRRRQRRLHLHLPMSRCWCRRFLVVVASPRRLRKASTQVVTRPSSQSLVPTARLHAPTPLAAAGCSSAVSAPVSATTSPNLGPSETIRGLLLCPRPSTRTRATASPRRIGFRSGSQAEGTQQNVRE